MVGVTRQRVSQSAPPDDLRGFPTTTHDGEVYRVARLSPWWFCVCGECRFDLDADAAHGRGTMYAADDRITGVIETIGPELIGRTIAWRFLADRTVWALAYDRPLVNADLTADAAIGYGITNELSTMVPYTVPQLWASAVDEHGWDGISYRTRFNTASVATGVALFDEAGAHPSWPAQRVCAASDPAIIADLASRSITVEDPPKLASLMVL